jgi:phosphate transport system substrate-binding protein
VVEIPAGEPFNCPECARPLKAMAAASEPRRNMLPVALIGSGALLVAVGAVLGLRHGATTPQAPAQQAAMAKPPVVPPPASPAAIPAPAPTQVPTPAPKPPAAAVPALPPVGAAAAAPASDVILRLAGSDLVGAALAPAMSSAYLAQSGDTDIKTEPGAKPGVLRVVGTHNAQREVIEIIPGSTDAGFAALATGAADIAMSAHQASAQDKQAAAKLGDIGAQTAEHVVAVDGLAVLVNGENRLRSAARDKIRGVLNGTITNWSALGGKPGPIVVYTVAPGSEAGRAVAQLALGGGTLLPAAHIGSDDEHVAEAVSQDPAGLGVITLPPVLLHSHFAVQVRPLAIADTGAPPVSPTHLSAVTTLDYPYAFRQYFYTAPNAASPVAKRFVDFAQSRDGENVVDTSGFVSQSVTPQDVVLPDSVSNRFREFIAGAKQLAVHFRFETNSSTLTTDGLRDMDRVVNYMTSNQYSGSNLILVGFADSQGGTDVNVALSQKRAEALAALFAQRGFKPAKVAGFGAELPLADNATEDGRQRNRRVEAYLVP